MSDSEDMYNFVMSDEASDFEEAPAPKKKGAAAKVREDAPLLLSRLRIARL